MSLNHIFSAGLVTVCDKVMLWRCSSLQLIGIDGTRHKGEARSEPERSDGNPHKSEQSHFCECKKFKAKRKSISGKIKDFQSRCLIFAWD
jgi:hypothetical protein